FDNVIVSKDPTSSFDNLVYVPGLKNRCCIGTAACAPAGNPNGFLFYGTVNEGNFSGGSNAMADVNGDGYKDLIVSSIYQNEYVYVLFGKAGGFPTTISVADLNGSNGFVITDSATWGGGGSFGTNVAAGDVDGDGIADILTTASWLGKGYVFYG